MKYPQFLVRREREILKSFAEVVIAGGVNGISVEKAAVIPFIEKSLSHIKKDVGYAIKLLLWIVEFAPIFTAYALRPFTKLPYVDRKLFLKRWANSKIYQIRIIYKSLSAYCFYAYYSHYEVQRAIGYDYQAIAQISKSRRE